ncbi:hypothetical protein EV401DRAFT_1413059 [Pisolithus croceorrhizus]|nr:hypothetical protein EV401DRAFT_1413059 [Pisolithus croceorrhizus]
MSRRVLIGFGVDVTDAMAGRCFDKQRQFARLGSWRRGFLFWTSPGECAGEVGVTRLLKPFKKYSTTATWFIPIVRRTQVWKPSEVKYFYNRYFGQCWRFGECYTNSTVTLMRSIGAVAKSLGRSLTTLHPWESHRFGSGSITGRSPNESPRKKVLHSAMSDSCPSLEWPTAYTITNHSNVASYELVPPPTYVV